MLDNKHNHLLQMGVVPLTAKWIVSVFVVLVAIFGMKIKVDLFNEDKADTTGFVWTVGGDVAGSLLLYVVAVSWCKHKGLLDLDMLLCFDCHYVCKFACMASMDQQSFFSGVEHSEVDEALFGFHDDSYLLPFDTTDSLMFSASPANGDQQSFVCGVEHSEVEDSHLLPLDAIFQNDMDSLMISASPANGEGLNNFFLPSPDRIHEQPPPLFEQSSFFYASVDPAMVVAAAAGAGGGCCMSAQSVAARQRRKRISEKTQELGRLIPGGMRMNTAPMLQAAFKYLQFLQAQFAILGLMDSFPECKSAKEGDLPVLLASPAIQESLAAKGMCVVPMEMVDGLGLNLNMNS